MAVVAVVLILVTRDSGGVPEEVAASRTASPGATLVVPPSVPPTTPGTDSSTPSPTAGATSPEFQDLIARLPDVLVDCTELPPGGYYENAVAVADCSISDPPYVRRYVRADFYELASESEALDVYASVVQDGGFVQDTRRVLDRRGRGARLERGRR
ncbi:MAG: hypothetical protein ABR600_00510 [Actinomycetota bacterium]